MRGRKRPGRGRAAISRTPLAQSGTATGSLCVWGLGASNISDCIPYSVGAGSYKQVQVVYDAPQNIGTVRFHVYPTPGGGTTDMDTTSLR